MFFYGVGNLLPNMAILTDMDYFIQKYDVFNSLMLMIIENWLTS
jgi:hypothetical protein